MVINTMFCALLIGPMAHAGLALASSIASYVNCGILLILLLRRKIYQPSPGWGRFITQLLIANIIVVAYLQLMAGEISFWLAKPALLRLGILLAHVLVALILYLVALRVCGMRPAQFRGQMKEF